MRLADFFSSIGCREEAKQNMDLLALTETRLLDFSLTALLVIWIGASSSRPSAPQGLGQEED